MTSENLSHNNAFSEDENSGYEVGVERRTIRHKDWSLPRRGKSKIATVKPVSKFMTSSEEDLSAVSDGESKSRRASLDRTSPRIPRLLPKSVTEMGKDALILELENCLNELEAEQMCNDSLEDDYVKIEEERNELVEELETAFSDLRDYTNRVKNAETEKNTIAEERDDLAKECEHLKYVLTHRDEVESQKYGWRKEKIKLEKLVEELESKNKELTFEIDNLYEERQGLISSLLNLNSVEVNEVIKTRSRTSSVVSTDSASSIARLKSDCDDITKFFTDNEDGSEQGSTAHQIVEYKRRIHELEGEREDLFDRCDTLESTKSMMEDERDIMHSRIKQLEEEVNRNEAKEQDLDNKSRLVDKLQEEVNRLTTEIKNIQSSIAASKLKHLELKTRSESLENENQRLKKELESAQSSIAGTQRMVVEERQAAAVKMGDLESEKEQLQREIVSLKYECDDRKSSIGQLETSLRIMEGSQSDVSKLKEQNGELVRQSSVLKEKIEERNRKTRSLENEKEELNYQLQKAKEEKSTLVGNLDKANKRISAVCDDLERAHKEKQKLRETVETLQNKLDDWSRREKELDRELQSVKTENEVLREDDRSMTEKRIKELELDFEDKMQELYKEREELSTQVRKLSNANQEDGTARMYLETENTSLKSKLRHLEKEKGSYSLLIREKNNLEKYLDNLKAESERNVKKYEEEIRELKERLVQFEEAHVSSIHFKQEKENYEKTIDSMKADNNKLREQIKRQRLSSSSAQELLANRLKTENEALDHRAEVLQDALNKANIENRSLLERMHRTEESTASTIRSLKARKSELQMQCSKLQHERDDFEREINQLRQHLMSLETNNGDEYETRKSQSEVAVSELEAQLRSREEELRNAHSKIAELELDNREHTRKLQASEILVLDLQNALARANDLAMEKALEVSRGKRTFEKKMGQMSKEYTDLKRKLFADGQSLSPHPHDRTRALSETGSSQTKSASDFHVEHTKVKAAWSGSTRSHRSDDNNSNVTPNSSLISNPLSAVNGLPLPNDAESRQRSSSQTNTDYDDESSTEISFNRQNSLPLSQRDNDSKFTFGIIASSNLVQSSSTSALPTTETQFQKEAANDEPPKKPPPPLFYDARTRSSPKLHRRIQLKQIPFPRLSPTPKVNGNEAKPRMEHWV